MSLSFWFCVRTVHQCEWQIDTAKLSLSLFYREEEEAAKQARELVELNQQRKDMTADGVEEANVCEEHYMSDKVLVIYLPQVHEVLQESLQEESGGVH